MSPTIEDGDLVVVRRAEYGIGDVVAFETGGGVVIHRIIGGSADDGFLLQGDNRPRPDSWRPTADEVLGKKLFHIPGAGDHVRSLLGNPVMLGGVLGGLGTFIVWSPSRRRARRRGAHQATAPRRSVKSAAPSRPIRGAGITLVALAIAGIVAGGVSLYLHLLPLTRTVDVERTLFEHTGSQSYIATVRPSVVYDGTTLTPDPVAEEPTTIFTRLLEDLQIDFQYQMSQPEPRTVRGEVSSELRIGAGDNHWTRRLTLLPSREFEGPAVSESFAVDLPLLRSLIARAEEETDYSPRTYELRVVTRIDITRIGDDQVRETLQVDLPMELSDTLLAIDEVPSSSGTVTAPSREVVPNEVEVLGLSLPVREFRLITMAVFVTSALAVLGFGMLARRRLGSGESARIRLRYGSLVVPASEMSFNGSQRIQVSSIQDLVRLARQAGQALFYECGDEDLFTVPDGTVVYEYRIQEKRRSRR